MFDSDFEFEFSKEALNASIERMQESGVWSVITAFGREAFYSSEFPSAMKKNKSLAISALLATYTNYLFEQEYIRFVKKGERG